MKKKQRNDTRIQLNAYASCWETAKHFFEIHVSDISAGFHFVSRGRTTVFCIPKITYARTPGFLSPRQETRTYVPKIFTSVPLAPPPRNTYLRTRIFLSSFRCHDPPSETDVKTSPDALKAQPRNWPLPGGQQENTDISNKYRARTKGRAFFLRNGPGCWVRQRG